MCLSVATVAAAEQEARFGQLDESERIKRALEWKLQLLDEVVRQYGPAMAWCGDAWRSGDAAMPGKRYDLWLDAASHVRRSQTRR